MTDHQPVGSAQEPTGPVIRDKRRIDPQTGRLRTDDAKEFPMTDDTPAGQETPGSDSGFAGSVGEDLPGNDDQATESVNDDQATESGNDDQTTESVNDDAQQVPVAEPQEPEVHPDTALAAERLSDLQRVQAEYVNYKRRVDRDREAAKGIALVGFVESLLPVLDEIHLARQHGDLADGTPFAKIADKLDGVLAKYGLSSFGEAGDEFDPNHHEALMHVQAELPQDATATTVVQVMQPGYKIGERVVRPARVSVADPQ
ncbi:nucleotide exchange factor GrpE [Calidifontibacter terrae]